MTAGRESAEARAFDRFFKNRIKQLGTLLPPASDAPEPDTALLWSFLSRQLAEGISNEAEVLPRMPVTSSNSSSNGSVGGVEAAARSESKRGAARPAPKAASQRGVVIAPPRPLPDASRTIPCPLPSWAPAAAEVQAASLQQHQERWRHDAADAPPALVHVFWDVESAHPGDRDPRLVAVEVLRLARRLGRVVGCYAYANRPAWAWVPSYFLESYVQRGPGGDDVDGGAIGDGEKRDDDGGGDGIEVGGVDGAGGAVTAAAAPTRVRCPVCGKPLAASRLEHHLLEVHPDKPEAACRAAAAAESGGGGVTAVKSKDGTKAVAKAAGTNSHRTGLGAVREYHSSGGVVYRPPAGHQLGLKYVLQREGIEPRVVQNADGAADRAVNGGIDRLLAALRTGKAPRAAATAAGHLAAADVPYTLVLVSGSRRHAAALSGCRQLGVRTVVVAAGPAGAVVSEPGQADALLGWELLAGGSYIF